MSDKRAFKLSDAKIEAWDLDQLRPADNNHKKHTDESTTKLAKSLADIGQIQPVIVDKEGEIIAGHGRWMAAQKLGWKQIKVIQVPVDRATAIKARIADNLMSNQDIDNDKLVMELSELVSLEDNLDVDALFIDDGHKSLAESVAAPDLSMDISALSGDIGADVEEFTKEGEEAMAGADEGEKTPLARVFGFTKLSTRQSRILKSFMAQVIRETGEPDPAEALTRWAAELME